MCKSATSVRYVLPQMQLFLTMAPMSVHVCLHASLVFGICISTRNGRKNQRDNHNLKCHKAMRSWLLQCMSMYVSQYKGKLSFQPPPGYSPFSKTWSVFRRWRALAAQGVSVRPLMVNAYMSHQSENKKILWELFLFLFI